MNIIDQFKSSQFLKHLYAGILTSLAGVILVLGYYIIWKGLFKTPIPGIYNLKYVSYQTLFFVLANGLVHYGYRDKKYESSYQYLKWLLILLGVNTAICYVSMNITMLPSANEIKRLYGDAGMPNTLHSLSVPISAIGSLVAMVGPPYFLNRKRKHHLQYQLKEYRLIAFKLFQAYIAVVAIILTVNLCYYQLYISSGGRIPNSQFSVGVLIQMAFALTAVAAMLFLYLRDNSENGLTNYVMFTGIVAVSAFMAGLPREDGQPVFDETLWLNVPLAVVGLAGELIGIPYFFKNLMKPKPESNYRK